MKFPRYVPILREFTVRVSGRSQEELLQSPAALARALADMQTAIGHDGVLCVYEPSLLSRACVGNDRQPKPPEEAVRSNPLSAVFDTLPALRSLLPGSAMIFAAFAGPGLLYAQLQEAFSAGGHAGAPDTSYAAQVVMAAVRSSLDLKADGVALIERITAQTPPELLRTHKRVRKLAEFYEAGFLVFERPGSIGQGDGLPAHCSFDLGSAGDGIGPVFGRAGPGGPAGDAPRTTAESVPDTTAIEDLKALPGAESIA